MARDYSHLLNDLERAETKALEKLNPDQKLSLCMIVKNEEKYLAGALDSVQGVVDEIIIVDTGSTDRTVEIAREYGAKVYFRPWDDDFAAARNESLKHATGQWVLVLDADERVPESVKTNLRALLVDIPQFISYATLIKNLQLNQGVEENFSHYVVRLFRKTPEAMFYGAVHESLYPNRGVIHLPETSFFIEHLGYVDATKVSEKQFERNAPLIEKALQQAKKIGNTSLYSFYCYYFSTTKLRVNEKLHWLKEAIQVGTNPQEQAFLQVACAQALFCFFSGRRYQEGVDFAEEQMKAHPLYENHVGVLDAYGLLLLGARQQDKAIAVFEKVLGLVKQGGNLFDVLQDERKGSWGTHLNLLLAYQRQGNEEKARVHAQEALAAYPLPDKTLILDRIALILEDDKILENYFASEDFTRLDESIQVKNLSNHYLQTNQPYEALVLQSKSIHEVQFLQNAFILATRYIDGNQVELVKQVLNACQAVLPEHEFSQVMSFYFQALSDGSLDKAVLLDWVSRAEAIQTQKLLLHLSLTCVLKDVAEELLDKLEQKGEFYFAQLRRALLEQSDENMTAARDRLQSLISQYPEEPEAYTQMGNLLISVQDFASAENIFSIACKLNSGDWYVFYGYSLALAGQNKLDEAKRMLSLAAHRAPDNPNIVNLMHLMMAAEAEEKLTV